MLASSSPKRCPARCGVPSFPTRRSSDLIVDRAGGEIAVAVDDALVAQCAGDCAGTIEDTQLVEQQGRHQLQRRSEEHTSELQSRVDLVCRLLLEKKNKDTDSRSPRRGNQ